jgi:hypothetical protein
MKTLITIILATLLAACGDCPPDAVIAPPEVVTVAVPEPIVTPPVSAPVSKPVVPEPIQACPQSTGCQPSPAQLPPNRIPVVEPNPTPACVRDNTPLVYIAPFWVDNCGNKYGQTN